jgi:uncharacterized protein
MVTITPHAEGCLLSVRAQPGARKNAVLGEHAGMLKITVTAPPQDGRANESITELLREWLGLKRWRRRRPTDRHNQSETFLRQARFVQWIRRLPDVRPLVDWSRPLR